MPTYICQVCERVFKQKGHFESHKKKKNPCKKDAVLEKIIEKKIDEKLNIIEESESSDSDE